MTSRAWTCVIVAACSRAPETPPSQPEPRPPGPTPDAAIPLPPPAPPAPRVELLVSRGTTLHWYEVSTTVTELRKMTLPRKLRGGFVWHRGQATFLLDDHRVARTTATGFEFVSVPPESAWVKPVPEHAKEIAPEYRLSLHKDAVWLGRCNSTSNAMYDDCDSWFDVRLGGGPLAIDDFRPDGPDDIVPRGPSLKVTPSTAIQVALVPDTKRPPAPAGKQRLKLVCTQNGKTIEDPPPGEPATEPHEFVSDPPYGRYDLVWLQTDPPMFSVGTDNCAPCPRYEIYEGCTRSTRFDSAEIGPDEFMVFEKWSHPTRTATLNRRGKTLGTIDKVHEMSFVPR